MSIINYNSKFVQIISVLHHFKIQKMYPFQLSVITIEHLSMLILST
jgi:hypothetical protein